MAWYARFRTEKQVVSGVQPYEFVRASSVHYLTFNTQARPSSMPMTACQLLTFLLLPGCHNTTQTGWAPTLGG